MRAWHLIFPSQESCAIWKRRVLGYKCWCRSTAVLLWQIQTKLRHIEAKYKILTISWSNYFSAWSTHLYYYTKIWHYITTEKNFFNVSILYYSHVFCCCIECTLIEFNFVAKLWEWEEGIVTSNRITWKEVLCKKEFCKLCCCHKLQ